MKQLDPIELEILQNALTAAAAAASLFPRNDPRLLMVLLPTACADVSPTRKR